MKLKIYDKVAWQLDGGMEKESVIEHFSFILNWCHINNLLLPEGEETLAFGVDESCSLHERMFTEIGNKFMATHYDKVANAKKGDEAYLNSLLRTIQ